MHCGQCSMGSTAISSNTVVGSKLVLNAFIMNAFYIILQTFCTGDYNNIIVSFFL